MRSGFCSAVGNCWSVIVTVYVPLLPTVKLLSRIPTPLGCEEPDDSVSIELYAWLPLELVTSSSIGPDPRVVPVSRRRGSCIECSPRH